MKFFQTFDVAASGMKAEQTRMDLISENIANANTAKSADGNPYRRKFAVSESAQKAEFESEFSSASFDIDAEMTGKIGTAGFTGGGVNARACEVSKNDPDAYKWIYDPSNPNAEKEGKHAGYVPMPNVNIITEMTNMMQATRAYEANSTLVESAKSMATKAMDIGKG